MIKRINQKVVVCYYGPFKILDKVGVVAYKFQLLDTSRIHPIFHVSLLKKTIGNCQAQGAQPTELKVALNDDFYPKKGVRLQN